MSVEPYDDLTPRGRIGRLRSLAVEVLSAYDLEVVRVSFVARAFNTVFRVDTGDGSTYALRVSPRQRIHADGCEDLEAAWVAALCRDAGLAVPQVIPARDGSAVVIATAAGVPEPRTCVLFDWVGGRQLRERMSPDLVRKTGEATAIVHDHAAAHASADASNAPPGALVADRVLYLRTPYRLDELQPGYGSVLTDAVDRAQLALDALWRNPPHPPHLLHGDVQPSNVMVKRREVTLIDFQDLIWGFEIQDAVIALRSFEHFDDTAALSAAFRAGYETVRPWPDADPETVAALQATRHLNVLNFGLSIRKHGLDEFIARHATPVVAWMRPGTVS